MEGAPIPSLCPPFPANPVVMNVVSHFTVYDSVLGVWRHPDPGNILCPFGPASEERGRQEGVGIPGYYRGWLIQLSVINFLY